MTHRLLNRDTVIYPLPHGNLKTSKVKHLYVSFRVQPGEKHTSILLSAQKPPFEGQNQYFWFFTKSLVFIQLITLHHIGYFIR